MPVLSSSAYVTVEDVLVRTRTFLNDAEVAGGDVLTDTAPNSIDLIQSAFERVQIEIAAFGGETMITDAWLINLPAMPAVDPEARLVVDDTGSNILYPNAVGNIYSNTPQLPSDLVVPLDLWERSTGTSEPTGPRMGQPNRGLQSLQQKTTLGEWEWKGDSLRFRGALSARDVKIEYEKQLQKLVSVTDPVPIRGVLNAAAWHAAMIFTASRVGALLPEAKAEAAREILLKARQSARRRQRKQVRRNPYSGRGGRQHTNF